MPDYPSDMSRYALLVIDMWNQHWCKTLTARVGELAPSINVFLSEARRRGALIIHAPSDTISAYDAIPSQARQNAKNAPSAPRPLPSFPANINEVSLPIDATDSGCEDEPRCPVWSPWVTEIDTIRVDESDAVSTDLKEIYNLLQQHHCEHLLVLGVHLNFCVLYTRPYSINKFKWLHEQGYVPTVQLVRDLTDAAYNPKKKPFINHFAGTDLVIKYIENHFCSNILSSDLVGGQPFRFAADQRPRHEEWLSHPNGVQLLCLGPSERRWLTEDASIVQLVPDRALATSWKLAEIGKSIFTLAPAQHPNVLLTGDPTTGQVKLEADTTDPAKAGARWWSVEAAPNTGNTICRLTCCSPQDGWLRYLDGTTGSLRLVSATSYTMGASWRIALA